MKKFKHTIEFKGGPYVEVLTSFNIRESSVCCKHVFKGKEDCVTVIESIQRHIKDFLNSQEETQVLGQLLTDDENFYLVARGKNLLNVEHPYYTDKELIDALSW